MLDRPAADEQALSDVGVGEALAQEHQHLQLALREHADPPRAGASRLHTERAQDRGGGIGIARGAELLEGRQRAPRLGDRGLPPAVGERPGEQETGPADIERHPEAAKGRERPLEMGDRGLKRTALDQGASERALALRDDQVGAHARAELRESLGARRDILHRAQCDLGFGEQLQQGRALERLLLDLPQAAAEDRAGHSGLSLSEMDRPGHVCRRRVVLVAGEEAHRLLRPPLREAQLGELRERLGVQRRLRCLADRECGLQLGFGLLPLPVANRMPP
jgi:hypothetical protein